MATVTNTGTSAQKLTKPDYIVVTEIGSDGADGANYILEDVIEDTFSIAQDDNETTDIECETSDSPVLSIVKLGKWQLSAEVGDTQKALLQAFCGFKTEGTKTYAPSTYKTMYVKVAAVFDGGTTKTALVLPKVQLNSRLLIESLNSNLARISFAGTAVEASIGSSGAKTPFYIDSAYTLPTAGA